MKAHKLCCWACFVAIAASMFGVTASGQGTPADPTRDAKMASAALNEFGLKLVSDLSAAQPHKNIFVSPVSVFAALAMTEQGVTGATRAAIRQALAVPHDVPEDQLHASAAAVLNELRVKKSVDLTTANALWSNQGLAPDFIERCRKFYHAEATFLALNDTDAAASQINSWVSNQTHAKIPSIVSPGNLVGAQVVLTNAIYFHGLWSEPFAKNLTRESTFHLAGSGEKKVQMMHRGLSFAYRQGHSFEAVALNYQSSNIRLYAILPTPGTSPEQVLAKVSLHELEPSLGGHVSLSLPRFRLDFSHELNESLKGMGMAAAFAPSQDFRPMGAGDLFISHVLHRAALEVNEEGTTAAGATAAVISLGAPEPDTKYLVFDRPFAVLLCDTQTGAILFAGVVYDPGT